jgi:hypothetical protein
MSLHTAVKHELKQVGLVTLYFLFCFAIVLTLKKLFLAEHQMAVSALIAGKVVVVLDHTSLGTRFDSSQCPGLAALYKTLVYTAIAFLIVSAEKVFHAYRESGALARAVAEVWEHRNWSVILAKVLCVGFAFAGYHLFVATDRRLGKGTLWRAIWGRR